MSRERDADCIDLNRTDFDVQYKQRTFVVESSRLDCFWESIHPMKFLRLTQCDEFKSFSSFNEFFSLGLQFPSVFARTCQHDLKSFCMRNSFSDNPFIKLQAQNCSNAEVCC